MLRRESFIGNQKSDRKHRHTAGKDTNVTKLKYANVGEIIESRVPVEKNGWLLARWLQSFSVFISWIYASHETIMISEQTEVDLFYLCEPVVSKLVINLSQSMQIDVTESMYIKLIEVVPIILTKSVKFNFIESVYFILI